MVNKPLYLFVGPSGSGKTTIANMLSDKYGYRQIWSYCTRPPRYENEPGHIFITDSEFDGLGELAAYTEYNGYKYGTTVDQLNNADIYVVDVPGVESLLKTLKDDNRPIRIFYFDASVYNRIHRMIDRGDSDMMIISRLLQDEQDDWHKQLDSLVWKYDKVFGKNIELLRINANGKINYVLQLILRYLNWSMED
jgi:guanylate kinase